MLAFCIWISNSWESMKTSITACMLRNGCASCLYRINVYLTKDNLKEDFTILSSFYIRFCHFRVLKIEEIAGRNLRLVKLTSKYLKIPWQNLQSGIYTTARYNQQAVYIPVQDWIFHLYNETRRTLVYIPFWDQTEYVNKVVHIPLLRSI